METLQMSGCVVYAGDGFSAGVLHMLRGSAIAAYCHPDQAFERHKVRTRELDHLLAMHFGWWDIVLDAKRKFELPA